MLSFQNKEQFSSFANNLNKWVETAIKEDQSFKADNLRDFHATCSDAIVIDTPEYLYKNVNMFGKKTLIYWKVSGRISTRIGHKK